MIGYIILGILIFIVLLCALYTISAYNKLIKGQNRVNTQWAQIEVQLTRRSDLIPNLVDAVKGYASHEKEIFEKVAAARKELADASSPGQAIAASDSLSGSLSRLFAVAEAYPALKADNSFINLQSSLKDTEDKIAYARQFYNDTVLIYKDRVQPFPSSLIAKIFNFKDKSYYIAEESAKGNMQIIF